MKKILYLIVPLFLTLSCTNKEENLEISNIPQINSIELFSKILSKAVSNDSNLRSFLKDEAMNQFDKDYDVFYPLVKNKKLADGTSFRDCLLEYTDEAVLSQIEKDLPLVNILIPDYSWINAFSVTKWDPKDSDVSVAYKHSGEIIVFNNGVKEGILGQNDYPDFPILIVKNNERMRYSSMTRGSGLSYSFVDDAFDNSKSHNTRVTSTYYYDTIYDIDEPDNFLAPSEIPIEVLNAYQEFGNNDYRYQRDNLYFGMTNQSDYGILNTYIREYLYKFRFKTALDGALYDATPQSDPNYADGYFPSKHESKRDSLSLDSLRVKDFRIEGNLEMRFNIIYGNANGTTSTNTISTSVPVSSLFTYDKIAVEFRHKTWVSPRKYIYTIDANCLVPQWYTADIQLPIAAGAVWNIGNTSTIIKISVEEFDSGEISVSSGSLTFSMSSNTTTENTSTNGQITTKDSYGTQMTTSQTSSYSYTKTNNSDNLGDALLNYLDPVVLNYENGKYQMYTYDTGTVIMMIIPKHI